MVSIDGYAMEVLAWAGFVKKEDPSKPRSTAQDSTSIVCVCMHVYMWLGARGLPQHRVRAYVDVCWPLCMCVYL